MAYWWQLKEGKTGECRRIRTLNLNHFVSRARCAGCPVSPKFSRVVREQCKRLCDPTSRLGNANCY